MIIEPPQLSEINHSSVTFLMKKGIFPNININDTTKIINILKYLFFNDKRDKETNEYIGTRIGKIYLPWTAA